MLYFLAIFTSLTASPFSLNALLESVLHSGPASLRTYKTFLAAALEIKLNVCTFDCKNC